MHESAIANRIIEEAKQQGDVKAIKIEVGELAKITADELSETMGNLVDWKIECYTKKAKVKCVCGYEGEPKITERGHDFVLFVCPECGEIPDVLEGKDLITKEVVVE
ncbi:MAG: hypothetical protein GY861_07040 [bacterium]|nr:hypothetical protein [bacterium]